MFKKLIILLLTPFHPGTRNHNVILNLVNNIAVKGGMDEEQPEVPENLPQPLTLPATPEGIRKPHLCPQRCAPAIPFWLSNVTSTKYMLMFFFCTFLLNFAHGMHSFCDEHSLVKMPANIQWPKICVELNCAALKTWV